MGRGSILPFRFSFRMRCFVTGHSPCPVSPFPSVLDFAVFPAWCIVKRAKEEVPMAVHSDLAPNRPDVDFDVLPIRSFLREAMRAVAASRELAAAIRPWREPAPDPHSHFPRQYVGFDQHVGAWSS